nr:molybdopterin-binding protein [Salinigranum rubrum]
MTQDTPDADESPPYDAMLSIPEATRRVHALRQSVLETRATEAVPLSDIGGRTLAADVVAEADQPPHSHATMDGFAFDATDDYPLRLRDVSVFPEDDPPELGDGEAVRIATGAPLPAGANAVLKREEATVTGEGEEHLDGPTLAPWTYVYRRGSNVSAGETLFTAGERLSPKDAILLRDLGHESVEVHERFSVALLATGTEIHEGRHTDLDSPMLAALVDAWGHEATYEGSVPDDYDTVRERVRELAAEYDVVVTTGGRASAGRTTPSGRSRTSARCSFTASASARANRSPSPTSPSSMPSPSPSPANPSARTPSRRSSRGRSSSATPNGRR